MSGEQYASVSDALFLRIKSLIPSHPEIMGMDSPWDLFKVDGFKCDDLQPSMFQADWALRKAQQSAREREGK